MFWIIVCGVVVCCIIYFIFIKPLTYWKNLGVPTYPLWKLWWNVILDLAQTRAMGDAVKKMYNDFPNVRYFGGYQVNKPALTLKDPELIKQITVKDFDHFVDHPVFLPDTIEPLWGKNLIALTGDKWRDMRATLSPSFTGSKMKMMFSLMSECAKQFAGYFEEQKERTIIVEMKETFTRFSNDVIASTAFGLSCDSLRDKTNDFYLMGKKVTQFGSGSWAIFKIFLFIMAPRVAKVLGLSMFDKEVRGFFKNLVKSNIEEREKKGIVRPDMIHLLMEAKKDRLENRNSTEQNKKKELLDDDDIAAQAMIFFFAGFDSVSTLMCFMAYELAINPEIQQKVQAEIEDVMNDYDGEITYEGLSQMKYMDMVISESLRKWPVVVIMDRVCVKPYTISPSNPEEMPVNLRVGDLVWLPTFGLHRNPEFYPEPERFDPERFSEDNKGNINPYAYIPFGAGPRNCIGNRFALMETKLVFAHLLSSFDITVVKKTPIPIVLARRQFQMNAEGGFWLGLEKRSTKVQ